MIKRKLSKSWYAGIVSFLMILSITGICGEKFAPWKFAVVCDTRGDDIGINKYITETIAKDIVKEKCEFVLVAGDLIDGCYAPVTVSYKKQFDAWKSAMAPVYTQKGHK